MTKEQYEKYSGMLYCKTCNRYVPKSHMYYKQVYQDGSITKCNVDSWLDRNKDKCDYSKYTKAELKNFLFHILYDDCPIFNDIALELNWSLEKVIEVYFHLNIKGKKALIRTVCDYCGKTKYEYPSVYLKNENNYCSLECYWKDKSIKAPKGENNPFYNRIKTKCTNCNKEIMIIPYHYNKKNEFGDNHNFCCKKCYWEYRSKYYVGEKCPQYGVEFSEERREKARQNLLNNFSKRMILDSSIQLKVNKLLDELGVKYIREYVYSCFCLDLYLPNNSLIIEVMGDYWHANPAIYNTEGRKINPTQFKDIKNDYIKNKEIKTNMGINILYLWESDINKRFHVCKKLVYKYIQNNGILENYNSFNYSLKNNQLVLNEELLYPYFELSLNDSEALLFVSA